jgi:hypothetical protein
MVIMANYGKDISSSHASYVAKGSWFDISRPTYFWEDVEKRD